MTDLQVTFKFKIKQRQITTTCTHRKTGFASLCRAVKTEWVEYAITNSCYLLSVDKYFACCIFSLTFQNNFIELFIIRFTLSEMKFLREVSSLNALEQITCIIYFMS